MVYQVGQKVVYGIHGVCSIVGVERKCIERKNICYYVLEPVDQSGSRYYLPSDHQIALSKIRPLCTKQELHTILTEPMPQDSWIQDENSRKQCYSKLISSIDIRPLVRMIRCLRMHRSQQMAAGKKLHLCDENFLRDAQRILFTETALVMDIPMDQVDAYLQNILG